MPCCRASHHKRCSFQGSSNLIISMSVPEPAFWRSTKSFIFIPNQNKNKFWCCKNEISFSAHLTLSNSCWLTLPCPKENIKIPASYAGYDCQILNFPLFQWNFAFLIVGSFGQAHPKLHSFEDFYVSIWYKDRLINTIEYHPTIMS